MTFNSKTISYSIIDENINELLSSEFRRAFQYCFSKVLKIPSE
jgi:hypothetical protein